MPKGSPELTATRRAEIIDACEELYREVPFKDITVGMIAERTTFTRASVYNYFKTKEELFLEIVRREYEALLADMEESLPRAACGRESYVDAWTQTLSRHGRALELFVLMNMQIMRNVEPARQEEFQEYLDHMVSRIARRVQTCLALSDEDAWDLVAHQLNYAMGLYPITRRVHGEAGAPAAFARQYKDFLVTLLTGTGL